MINPMNLLQLQPSWEKFKGNHPKLLSFIKRIGKPDYMEEGSLIEITITNTQGQKLSANVRVKQDDLEFLRGIREAM